MEQTIYLGSSTTDVVVYTQAINSSGSHVTLLVNTSTSKLVFADGTVSSATPTVASLGTGKAKITFASVSNSSLSAGDTVAVRINGTADGVAFSEYMIPVFVATASSGGGGGSSLTQADIRTAIGLSSANLDTQLADIPTVSEFNARTKPTADYFDHTSDQVAVSAVNDKTGYSLATAPPTAAEVYAEFTSGSNEDVFKADVSGLSTFDASTDQVTVSSVNDKTGYSLATAPPTAAEVYAEFTSGNNEDVFKADVSGLSTFDASTDQVTVSSVNDKTGYSLSTAPPTAAEVYAEFTSGSNEDAFKADVSGLSTFDASTDQVVASNMRGTDNALLAANAPANFANLGINSSGDVSRVTLVDTTTSNTDQRGTDNAILASSAPANWGSLSINSNGHIDRVVLTDTTTTNSDMVDVSSLATASDLAVVDGVVDAIKLKTDSLTFTVSGQVDANALTGGGGDDAATIYSYFTASNREDQFKSDVSGLATSADLATVDSNVDSIKAITDQMVFTVSGQIDANALTGGGGDDAATIYSYFTASNREDQFKADVSSLASSSDLAVVDSNVDGIKSVTDQISFSVAGQVDANALSGGGPSQSEVRDAIGLSSANLDSQIAALPSNTYSHFTAGTNENEFKDGDVQGAGSVSHTVTINLDGSPAPGVKVWVSTDVTGSNVVAGTLFTNNVGQATFLLNPGTYYLWASKAGINFTNPQGFTVS